MLSENDYKKIVWKKYFELNLSKKDEFYDSQCYRKYKTRNINSISKLIAIFTSIVLGTSGLVYAGILTYEHFFQKTSSTEYYYSGLATEKYNDIGMKYVDGFYYKKISNIMEYNEVKSKLPNLEDLNKENFDNNFVMIIISENTDMPGLYVSKIETDEKSLYIEVDKNSNEETNKKEKYMVSTLIESQYNRENVLINKKINYTNSDNYERIESLPLDYTLQSAEKDNCIIVNDMKIKDSDKEKIDSFINNTQSNKDGFIRIVKNETVNKEISLTIIDIQYTNNQYKVAQDFRRNKLSEEFTKNIVYKTFNKISTDDFDTGKTLLRLEDTFALTSLVVAIYE